MSEAREILETAFGQKIMCTHVQLNLSSSLGISVKHEPLQFSMSLHLKRKLTTFYFSRSIWIVARSVFIFLWHNSKIFCYIFQLSLFLKNGQFSSVKSCRYRFYSHRNDKWFFLRNHPFSEKMTKPFRLEKFICQLFLLYVISMFTLLCKYPPKSSLYPKNTKPSHFYRN